MPPTITVCIPTCRRPKLLVEAVRTCFEQAYRPLEILIGDDSGSNESKDLVAALDLPDGVTLKHQVHDSRQGQARNVNWLFTHAQGSRLVLLHDDDGLCAHALTALVAGWDSQPDTACAYGKFEIVSPDGTLLPDDTRDHNERYGRVSSAVGRQPSALSAALSQQMPHNGYLVDAELARQVLYRFEEEIGLSGDLDFGIRLAQAAGSRAFVFVDSFISYYRLTQNSLLRSRKRNYGEHLLQEKVEALVIPPSDEPARELLLSRMSMMAALNAAQAGRRKQALSILRSKHYPAKPWDPRTIYRMVYTISPWLGDRMTDLLPSNR